MEYESAVHEAMAVLGGTPTAMAVGLGAPQIKRQNIEHWLKNGRVPADHAPTVEAATRKAGHVVLCERLCHGPRWDVLRRSGKTGRNGESSTPTPASNEAAA